MRKKINQIPLRTQVCLTSAVYWGDPVACTHHKKGITVLLMGNEVFKESSVPLEIPLSSPFITRNSPDTHGPVKFVLSAPPPSQPGPGPSDLLRAAQASSLLFPPSLLPPSPGPPHPLGSQPLVTDGSSSPLTDCLSQGIWAHT